MRGGRVERLDHLARAITTGGILRLRDAARLLGVSEMTVRRDIAAAPDRFAFFGGHVMAAELAGPAGAYEMTVEADSHAGAKRAACRHALTLIEAEATLFIDCGTTLAHLAEMLPDDKPLTVLCYSLNVATPLATRPNVRLILLGGLYHPESASFSADLGAGLDRFALNAAFISAGGVDEARGVSCSHLHEVAIKQKAMQKARARHLVVDSSKFGRLRPALFAELREFDTLVSETGIRHLH